MTFEDLDDLVEGHLRDHGGVPDRLQVHVSAVLGAFQLDDDEAAVPVDTEEVDPPSRVFPVAELLRDDQYAVGDDLDLRPQQALEIAPFADTRGGKALALQGRKTVPGHFVERHSPSQSTRSPRASLSGDTPAQRIDASHDKRLAKLGTPADIVLVPETDLTPRPEVERSRQLFRFLKAFAERDVPIKRTLREQRWVLRFADLPAHVDITRGEVAPPAAATPADEQDVVPLLRVRRPKVTSAPAPPKVVAAWLAGGCDDPSTEPQVNPERRLLVDGEAVTVAFEADLARVAAYDGWHDKWTAWAAAERPARRTMAVFEKLYALHAQMEREGESVELLVGDGRLRWRTTAGEIDHPVLLQRVELMFDAKVPAFSVVDADRAPELYSVLLQGSDLSPQELQRLREQADGGEYHPLAREATDGYLRRLAQLLGPRGHFAEDAQTSVAGADPLIARDPVLLLRTRVSGFPAAFDRVLQDLDDRAVVPTSLTRLVGVESAPNEEPARETCPPSPWREPDDVLLSKPANLEQIQMAHALERHQAVLVQGPPGTGKSHTIANLVGHLMAQGKRVLVTSHTTKALRVLRGHIVEELRPLCVAVLDQDLESRSQMEQSVRGILGRLTRETPGALAERVARLSKERSELNTRIDVLTQRVREAREAEYLPIVVAGEAITPSDAARWVSANAERNDWIPGPIASGAPNSLSTSDIARLYALNGELSSNEEREIELSLPDLDELPSPYLAVSLCAAIGRGPEPPELARFWRCPVDDTQRRALQELLRNVEETSMALGQFAPWQRAVVSAGAAGGPERQAWTDSLASRGSGAYRLGAHQSAPARPRGHGRERGGGAGGRTAAAHVGDAGASSSWRTARLPAAAGAQKEMVDRPPTVPRERQAARRARRFRGR